MLLYITAFAAGLISFFSPCIVPLIPGFLAFLTGDTLVNNKTKINWTAFYKSLSFVAGFSIIFILMGLSISSMGIFLIKHQKFINVVGGALIILFGLHLLDLFQIPFLLKGGVKTPKYSSGFFLGIAFSAAWTPCVGPVLGSILIIAGTEGSALQGGILLMLYSLGIAIPFMLFALFWGKLVSYIKYIAKISWYINKAAGFILVILGFLIMTGRFTWLSKLLS